MARQYSPRSFLRHTSNSLLGSYFHEQDLLMDLDFASLKGSDVEPIFTAWQALPTDVVGKVDSDFSLADSLADEQGILTLLKEGEFQGLDLQAAFEAMPCSQDKALWTLFKHPKVALVASRFREADRFPEGSWARRREKVPITKPRDDAKACEEFGQALGSYFKLKEGRGQQCHVDAYRRGNAFCYFAYPEDHAQTALEYSEEGLEPRARRPAFEVVFVYDPQAGALNTFHRGAKETRRELEKLFARVILRTEIDLFTDDKVYDLGIFKHPKPRFVYDPGSGIQAVFVTHLRFSLLGGGKRRITLEADPADGGSAMSSFVDATFRSSANGATEGLTLALANVTRVGLQVQFAPGGHRGRSTKTFYLTHPNGCSLKHEGQDEMLRRMLMDSGIEPARPAAAAAAKG